jgi:hypothetical protein
LEIQQKEHELPIKAQAGQYEDIRKCIARNTCMQSVFQNGKIEYLVNPVLGREKELILELADKPKKVLIFIGPRGMNASHIALKKNILLISMRKIANLGGQLILAINHFHKRTESVIGISPDSI